MISNEIERSSDLDGHGEGVASGLKSLAMTARSNDGAIGSTDTAGRMRSEHRSFAAVSGIRAAVAGEPMGIASA